LFSLQTLLSKSEKNSKNKTGCSEKTIALKFDLDFAGILSRLWLRAILHLTMQNKNILSYQHKV